MCWRIASTVTFAAFASYAETPPADACARPLVPYAGEGSVASIVGTVIAARGTGPEAVYKVRRESILTGNRAGPIPTRITIDMAKLWMGTCGFDSVRLRTGDRIMLYFVLADGRLKPRGWKML
jgi:hypothetical protein